MNNKNSLKNLGTKLGHLFGSVCAVCIAACATSIVLALTIKFITWLF